MRRVRFLLGLRAVGIYLYRYVVRSVLTAGNRLQRIIRQSRRFSQGRATRRISVQYDGTSPIRNRAGIPGPRRRYTDPIALKSPRRSRHAWGVCAHTYRRRCELGAAGRAPEYKQVGMRFPELGNRPTKQRAVVNGGARRGSGGFRGVSLPLQKVQCPDRPTSPPPPPPPPENPARNTLSTRVISPCARCGYFKVRPVRAGRNKGYFPKLTNTGGARLSKSAPRQFPRPLYNSPVFKLR